jgi:nitroreductase
VDGAVLVERTDRLMRSGGVPDSLREMLTGMAKGMLGGMSAAQRAEWAKCQVYLALGNAVNGAKSLGLDSCPMTGFDPVELGRILALPDDHLLTALCPVGYPADTPMGSKLRLPLGDILF